MTKKKNRALVSHAIATLRMAGVVDCPLRLREVTSADDWARVAHLRKTRYEEKVSTAALPDGPEPDDFLPTVKVFMVKHSKTGELLGTIRYRDTSVGAEAVGLGAEYIPTRLTDKAIYSYADRLVIAATPMAVLVKGFLMKAYWLQSARNGVDNMALYTRRSLERGYRALGFAEHNGETIRVEAMEGLGNIPHVFLTLPMSAVNDRFPKAWRSFFWRKHAGLHWPDIHARAVIAWKHGLVVKGASPQANTVALQTVAA